MNTLINGEDKTLIITIEDSLGTGIDFDDLIDMRILLSVNGKPSIKFAKEPATGFQDIVATAVANEAKIIIKASDTLTMDVGIMKMEVQLTIDDDDYDDGRKDFQQVNIFNVQPSLK